MKCKMNLEERRALLDSFGGRFYSIEWVKADKSVRSCTARHMQHDMFAQGHASKANVSTVAHKPEMYTCVDVSNQKWVNVNLCTLKTVHCGDVEIELQNE